MINFVIDDLFKDENSLVNCISADIRMSAGIARDFRYYFGGINKLKEQDRRVGKTLVLRDGDRYIFYLVTKLHYWEKPAYADIEKSLQDLRYKADMLGIKELSMPLIGCGKDKKDWNRIRFLIEKIFHDYAINIYVLP